MIARSVFEYLVNSLWQVPLLAFATWLVVRAARPALRVQHTLWFAALVLAVLMPLRGIDFVRAPAALPDIALDTNPMIVDPPATPQTVSIASRIASLLTLRIHPLQLRDRTIDLLVGLYGVSIAFSLARLLHSYIATRRLLAQAISHPLTMLESSLLSICAQRLQIDTPTVRFLAGAASPMVIGVRHPVLLLPKDLRHDGNLAFNDRTLTAILSHELAHIRRRDYLANLVARVVALPIAYHPATFTLQRRIRQTREMICDAHAATAFESSSTYARSLLALAERLLPKPSHVEAVGLFANARNTLEERIMKLTEPRLPIGTAMRTLRVATGTIALVAATATAATLHLKPAAPEVYAAQAMQADQQPQAPQVAVPAPTPAPSPAPEPNPAPRPHPRTHAMAGGDHELTPEEQAKLDQDLAAAKQQMHDVMEQFNNGEFQAKLQQSMKAMNSDAFKQQMAAMQEQMKQFNTPEFRRQMAEAGRAASNAAVNNPEFKRQMEEMTQRLKSDEFRREMAQAKQLAEVQRLAWQAKGESKANLAEARQQLAEATRALAEARKQVHDAETQKHLDEAQRRIDEAAKKF